ncbi:MAG: hypothetical protein AABY22_29115 [Nanoarchaeota archaeon]
MSDQFNKYLSEYITRYITDFGCPPSWGNKKDIKIGWDGCKKEILEIFKKYENIHLVTEDIKREIEKL